MKAGQLSAVLLALGAIALGATPYLGSPWPGVVLAGLALLPWVVEAWLDRTRGTQEQAHADVAAVLGLHTQQLLESGRRIEEQGQQINSLRNAVSMRGTLGG